MEPHVPLKDLIREAMPYCGQSQSVKEKGLTYMCTTEMAASGICIPIATDLN
jgi:hypothetical protein